MTTSDTQPARRIVILGASNVRRGVSTLVATAEQLWPGDVLELMFAVGHGRSYGHDSWVLGRTLPSILECGLWEALANCPPLPTHALVMDIGNDLIYGRSTERIMQWVETCLDRLGTYCDRITVAQLPIDSVLELPRWQFLALRNVLFPFSKLTLDDAVLHIRVLNERIEQLPSRYPIDVVSPQPSWYGIDPIHIRRLRQRQAWHTLLGPWRLGDERPAARRSVRRWWHLHRMRPQYRKMFGVEQHADQPAGMLRSGSIISMF